LIDFGYETDEDGLARLVVTRCFLSIKSDAVKVCKKSEVGSAANKLRAMRYVAPYDTYKHEAQD
jgi:hypothetical protein